MKKVKENQFNLLLKNVGLLLKSIIYDVSSNKNSSMHSTSLPKALSDSLKYKIVALETSQYGRLATVLVNEKKNSKLNSINSKLNNSKKSPKINSRTIKNLVDRDEL